MLKTAKEEKNGVGVIVGRFQTDELTQGHMDLIDSVIDRHKKTIIFIGLSSVQATKNNPLDYRARFNMINEKYPKLDVYYIKDHPSNKEWSKQLDDMIGNSIPPESKVTLYGSRDSFISSYEGRYKCEELIQREFVSATKIREDISYSVGNSSDFRKGAIWATQNQYDSCFPTVDVAIVKKNEFGIITDILFAGKRIDGGKKRFIGGFVQPQSNPDYSSGSYLEQQAKREVSEETHLEVSDFKYLGSFVIDDWRYRSEKNKIVTTLFMASYIYGKPEADDDIDHLEWVDVNNLDDVDVVEYHQFLLERVKGEVKQINQIAKV